MAFELKSAGDSQVLFLGSLDTADYESGSLDNGQLDGVYEIPLPFGNIRSQQWFINGVRLMYSEYQLDNAVEFEWKGDLELVTMYFNLKGRFSLKGLESAQAFELGNYEHNLFFGGKAGGRMKLEELRMRSFMIQFTKTSFLKIASDGNDALKRFADQVCSNKIISLSKSNLHIDLAMQTCIQSILNCRYTEPLKRLFYYSKAIELLVLQAEAFDNLNGNQAKYVKSDYDKECILFARDYLIERLNNPPALSELSRIAGINEFKLKKGFKEIFGITVFGYLNEIKMEIAKSDLLEKRKNVTEIAYELGFSSLQHFSYAFKKKFGVPPNQAGKILNKKEWTGLTR